MMGVQFASMAINCPGYNPNVLPNAAHGTAVGDDTTQQLADASAKASAEADALFKAFAQFPNNMCPSPCLSIPILHLVDSGAISVPAAAGATHFASIGWADAQLDVLCIRLPPEPAPRPSESVPRPDNPIGEAFGRAWARGVLWVLDQEFGDFIRGAADAIRQKRQEEEKK